MGTTKETTAGQARSSVFRGLAGLPERKSDAPGTDIATGKDYETPVLERFTEPEGGYGGDPDRTMGVNQPYERRPSTRQDTKVVEGPPNPPEGKAHNMSSGQWAEDVAVSPVNTDDPVQGVKEPTKRQKAASKK